MENTKTKTKTSNKTKTRNIQQPSDVIGEEKVKSQHIEDQTLDGILKNDLMDFVEFRKYCKEISPDDRAKTLFKKLHPYMFIVKRQYLLSMMMDCT